MKLNMYQGSQKGESFVGWCFSFSTFLTLQGWIQLILTQKNEDEAAMHQQLSAVQRCELFSSSRPDVTFPLQSL